MPDRIDVLAAFGKWICVPVLGGVVAYYVVTTLVVQNVSTPPVAPATRDVSIDQDAGTSAATVPSSDPSASTGGSEGAGPDSNGNSLEPDAIQAGITAPEVDVTVSPDKADDPPVKHHHPRPKPSTPPKSAAPATDPMENDGAADNGDANGGTADNGTTDNGTGSDGTSGDAPEQPKPKPKPKTKRKRRGSKNPPTEDSGDSPAGVGPGACDGNTGNL